MVVGSINRFSPFSRSKRTLLIKEVNPIGVEFFVDRYFPKIVLILRHPAAVADSFKRMGWLDIEE